MCEKSCTFARKTRADEIKRNNYKVHNLCAKRATANEVRWMLDLLFNFADDKQRKKKQKLKEI